jgi:23S rRNA pseudouridine1911/1915/1917 synthase
VVPALSRTRLQALIAGGHVRVGTVVVTAVSHKILAGVDLAVDLPALEPAAPEPQAMALDVLYEDGHLLVLNKPPGLVVHPGAGNRTGTLVSALLHHCGASLSGIGGVTRPGIVHRLDKDTSGLMVVAKTDLAHQALTAQLVARTLWREYIALALGPPPFPRGVVDASIARDPRHRLKMAVRAGGRAARTHWKVLYVQSPLALVVFRLETGRTHQIRVHAAHAGFPLIGDPLYGPPATRLAARLEKADMGLEPFLTFPRQALHARALAFAHPATGQRLSFSAPPPADLQRLVTRVSPGACALSGL